MLNRFLNDAFPALGLFIKIPIADLGDRVAGFDEYYLGGAGFNSLTDYLIGFFSLGKALNEGKAHSGWPNILRNICQGRNHTQRLGN